MARQQFEDQFKNKLDSREIKPSEGSWEQLAGRLDSAEKRSVPIFWWVGIAATIVGGILIYSLMFTFNPNVDSPVIVDAPSEKATEEKFEVVFQNVPVVAEEVRPEKNSEEAENSSEKNNLQNNKTPITKKESLAIVTAEEEQAAETTTEVLADTETAEEIRIRSKLEEAIAEVSSKAISQDATDAEIDALLYKAAGEISLEQHRNYSSGSVNASDLLYDVEMELEESFRDKVFDLLKDGYTKARSAVANRN